MIPKNRQQDVIDVFWQLLTAAEGRADNALDRAMVEGGYRLMQDLGVTTASPRWLK